MNEHSNDDNTAKLRGCHIVMLDHLMEPQTLDYRHKTT